MDNLRKEIITEIKIRLLEQVKEYHQLEHSPDLKFDFLSLKSFLLHRSIANTQISKPEAFHNFLFIYSSAVNQNGIFLH